MSYINKQKHHDIISQKDKRHDKCKPTEYETEFLTVSNEFKGVFSEGTVQFASTYLLEKNMWLLAEKQEVPLETATLSRGRVVLVNPGVNGIGREQRYIHPYIVLGEYKETFIGVPITNKAKNKAGEYYLRNYFEVDLIDPDEVKGFTEYRNTKPSVADVRNISGLDKRRIIQNTLYLDKKFAPKTYLNAISTKIRESIALIVK